MRELNDLINFLGNSLQYEYDEDKEFAELIGNNLHRVFSVDKTLKDKTSLPDFILKLKDFVLIIEHFEFDATFNNKDGSQSRKNEYARDKDWEQKINASIHDVSGLQVTYETNDKHSLKNYDTNLKTIFTDHYLKIQNYKENLLKRGLINENDEIKVAFLIIDRTTLGNIVLHENKLISLSVFRSSKFLELLERSINLDFVFNGYFNGSMNKLTFASNKLKTIEYLKSLSIDFNSVEYINFEPKEVRGTFKIPYQDNNGN